MRIGIVSTPFANGVCWLLNCFLELDILCFRIQLSNMWRRVELPQGYEKPGHSTFSLTPQEYGLQRHIPIFMRKTQFQFLDDITVEWHHDYPFNQGYDKIILFTRDPRDAMLSMYKRIINPLFLSETTFNGLNMEH